MNRHTRHEGKTEAHHRCGEIMSNYDSIYLTKYFLQTPSLINIRENSLFIINIVRSTDVNSIRKCAT